MAQGVPRGLRPAATREESEGGLDKKAISPIRKCGRPSGTARDGTCDPAAILTRLCGVPERRWVGYDHESINLA